MSDRNRQLLQTLSGTDRDDIRAFAAQRIGQQDADDILQDAYLQLLQRSEQDAVREPRAFLFKVVANLSIDAWRKATRRAATVEETEQQELEAMACRHPGPDASADGAMAFERFLALLDELPLLPRHAFILHKLDGLTHAQVAERLGVSSKSVQRYLVEAMAHFAERLENFPP